MANTTNYSWNLPQVGGNQDAWGDLLNANWTALDTLLGGTSAAEFAILDGATVTTAELNKLDGVTATTAEINYVSGVTSSIQTQINTKAASSISISAGSGLTGGGNLTANRTISHADTSSQGSVNNSGLTFIQDVTLDTYGHVTNLNSATVTIPASSPIMSSSTGTNIPVGAYVFGISSQYTSHNLGTTFSASSAPITVYGGSSQFVITYGNWITLGREGGSTFMYQRIS